LSIVSPRAGIKKVERAAVCLWTAPAKEQGLSMAFSIYDVSVSPLVYMLENLGHVLSVGETHARDNGGDAKHYLEARLAPDMFNLTKQVQVATDMSKGCGARL